MIDFILQLDVKIFLFINTYINNKIFDYIFIFFHDCHKNIWFILLLLFLWFYFIFKHKKNRLSLIILVPLSIIITDQIGSYIKDLEIRQRPYMIIDSEEMNLLVHAPKYNDGHYKNTKSSKKSFPSNHAANIWALTSIVSYLYSNQKKYFLILAILISISRVYVGVHYPIDIIIGSLIGLTVGYVLKKVYRKLIR